MNTKRITPLALAIWAAGAIAAEPAPKAEARPANSYRSAFTDYRPYREQPLASWPEVNDEMRRLGGHAGHAGQAENPHAGHGKPPAAEAQASPTETGSGHHRHHQ